MDKQKEIIKYLQTVEFATVDDIYQNVPFYYYANANKHLGVILSRMVESGKIERVKKGVFKYVKSTRNNTNIDDKQVSLF